MRTRSARLVLAVAFGLAALPARAGLFSDDEAHARIDQLRKDFEAASQRIDQAAKNQMDFANQIEALKSELARLRGQIEVVTNELESTQKRQKDFYIDLDTRLRKLEQPTAAAAPEAPPQNGAAPAETPKADPAAETRDYDAALALLKGAKYKEALAAFQAFVKNHPNSTLLPSATYWAASSHYQLRDYGRAAEMFNQLVATWPSDAKAPDALLAAGNAQLEAGDGKAARRTMETLIQKYPGSSAAASAKARLKSLPKKR